MKPIRVLAATILCQSILLSPVAMAQKERSGETQKKKAKQEQRQQADQAVAAKKDAEEKKAKAKAEAEKRDKAIRQNRQAAQEKEKRQQKAREAAQAEALKRERSKVAAAEREKASTQEARKLEAKRQEAKKREQSAKLTRKEDKPDKKDLSGKKDQSKKKVAEKKDKADKKPMPLPGKRPNTDKKDDAKQKLADKKAKEDKKDDAMQKLADKKAKEDKKEELKDKAAAKKEDSKQSAKKDKKAAKRMDLPGKRPQVSETERKARAERLRKEADKRQAERKRDEAKKDKKVRERRKEIVKAGQNSRKVRRPDVRNNNTQNNNWWNTNNRVNNNRITNNRDVRYSNTRINNTTVVNRNFERNVNWTTRKRDWGYNPWWNRPQTRPWYGNSWNGRWNRDYYRSNYRRGYNDGYHDGYRPPGYSTTSVGAAIGWGLIGWSLGTMVYDSGYQRYQNPYPVSTPVSYRDTQIDYTQPITRVAVQTAPEDDAVLVESTERSESIIAESQDAFRERNYLVALELADRAIAESPGDGALHEYRALVLFALGKYGDAAGVLNPVLASGPGWDWGTMIALYDSQQTYTDQLQRLETYSEQHPDSADTHFLLGYHYMVCGHTDLATPQFDMAAQLMPADSVSRQLAELTSASADPDDEEAEEVLSEEEIEDLPEPEPVPLEKLTGTWTSTREDGSTVTLLFRDDGKFTWNYAHDGEISEFSGDYSMNDDGLLVLDSEESQMVATVELPEDQEMNFVLAGGPPEDPGLNFTKG